MAMEDGLGDLSRVLVHFGEGFEDGALADAHVTLDAGEIEHGLGNGPIHVEENHLRKSRHLGYSLSG